MDKKVKITTTITEANFKTIRTKAEKIAKAANEPINLSMALRAILNEYERIK
jgi:3-deoxy-D-manno-octulosonic-acid transferase